MFLAIAGMFPLSACSRRKSASSEAGKAGKKKVRTEPMVPDIRQTPWQQVVRMQKELKSFFEQGPNGEEDEDRIAFVNAISTWRNEVLEEFQDACEKARDYSPPGDLDRFPARNLAAKKWVDVKSFIRGQTDRWPEYIRRDVDLFLYDFSCR